MGTATTTPANRSAMRRVCDRAHARVGFVVPRTSRRIDGRHHPRRGRPGGRPWGCRAVFDQALYDTTTSLNDIVTTSLDAHTVRWYVYPLVTAAGLATSFSPCILSVLPLTVGYIAGYADTEAPDGGRSQVSANAFGFSVGVASTLAVLGVASSTLGKTYGQIGPGLPIAVSLVAIVMGLNLLDVLEIRFPSLFQNFDARALRVPPLLKSYLAGVTFAFVSSPCSTPVLASLLAYAATLDNPSAGGVLLMCYALGYVAPVQVAASTTEVLKNIPALRNATRGINTFSGMLLVGGGTYFLLENVA